MASSKKLFAKLNIFYLLKLSFKLIIDLLGRKILIISFSEFGRNDFKAH